MAILAIDPGPKKSAWMVLDDEGIPARFSIDLNETLLEDIDQGEFFGCRLMAIEKVASFGMPVGEEVFSTVFWSGRFAEAWRRTSYVSLLQQITRHEIKIHLCRSARANDATVRQALMDRFGGSSAKGTKREPGVLYGVSKDCWSALAVGVTAYDKMQETK